MITEQERLEGFKQILLHAEQRFGVTIAAYYQERIYQNGQRQPSTGYEFALIDDWKEPVEANNSKENAPDEA